jgi:Family of unknown function (DUF6544)
MRKGLTKTILVGGNSLALLAGVAWLGLRVKPAPFPPHPERTPELDTSELPSELPEPVRKYFRATLSEKVPVIESAVVWGRADFKVGRLWTRMRFKGYYIPGREFRRDMEITWFGVPVLRGSDAYLGGEGSLEITGLLNTSSRAENFDQGQNLAMWAEAPFTTPSVLVLDSRLRWEPIDAHTARLVVPFGEREETLRVEFDPDSGFMRSMSGMRYRSHEETKTAWHGEFSEWRTLHGIKVPHRNVAIWEDQGGPYGIFEIEGAEYNVDVSGKISPDSFEVDEESGDNVDRRRP